MIIEQIKAKMLEYRDFYGGDIMYAQEIKEAKTKKELAKIINNYRGHLEDMLSDAHGHLDNFKTEIGLNNL